MDKVLIFDPVDERDCMYGESLLPSYPAKLLITLGFDGYHGGCDTDRFGKA